MIERFLISLVIPTYNRYFYLKKLISKFINTRCKIEILICDSNSIDGTKNLIKRFKKKYPRLNIKYFNVIKNNNSLKRNVGIKKSKGKYIICIDDDCIPEAFFLKKYLEIFTNCKNSEAIFCGSVKYTDVALKKNFTRYRQSRHFILNNQSKSKILEPKNIVTMNMGFEKKTILKKKLLFNEKFNKYGFEDYDFAYRAKKAKIHIMSATPTVYHLDDRSFEKYLEKIKFMGYQSSKFLKKLNYDGAINNNFIKLENNSIIKFLLKFFLINKTFDLLSYLFIIFDKKCFYLPLIYKPAMAIAYLQGCILRNNKEKSDKLLNDWYK